ncbi:MAG: hypothetical protein H7069_09770 [Phormidesmis sp. FL-bin-119]|nr:hypothetical protein [Pedobacter sp.]
MLLAGITILKERRRTRIQEIKQAALPGAISFSLRKRYSTGSVPEKILRMIKLFLLTNKIQMALGF